MKSKTKAPLSTQAFTLPLGTRLGWASGSLVTSTILFVSSTFFMRYLTDYVGMAAAMAGTILAITKIFDALINPMMGMFSDRSSGTGSGSRRRRFLLIGAVIGAISLFGMFNFPDDLTAGQAGMYALAMLMLSSMGYTAFNVSYLAMPAEMTALPAERANLISFRIYAMAMTQFIVGGLAPMIVLWGGGGKDAYGLLGLALGCLVVGVASIAYLSTRKAPYTVFTGDMRTRFWSALPTLFKSRLYTTLVLLKATFLIGSTAHTATAAYYVHHVMRANDSILALFLVVYSGGMVLSQMLWLRLSRLLGRKVCFAIAAGLYAVISVIWAQMGEHIPTWVFLTLSALNGIGAGGILLVSEAMLPDAIEEDYHLSGIRREGTLASVFAFAEKFAHAAGLALTGLVLSYYNYTKPAPGTVVDGSALEGIMAAYGLLPAFFVGISMLWLLNLRGRDAVTQKSEQEQQ